MKVALPVAEFHRGNTSEYVRNAFIDLGHTVEILNESEFRLALDADTFDLYFGIDSGKSFSLFEIDADLSKFCFWFIDYRHHWDGTSRAPGDLENCRIISDRGGWVFQAQYEDVLHAQSQGVTRCSWLPLAADPNVWKPEFESRPEFDLGFVGNVWDRGRAAVLQRLIDEPTVRFLFPGHSAAWKEDGARLLSRCKAGFNVPSWYGAPYAFDINMRVFETLSCGRPLITNWVPSLYRIIDQDAPYVRTYRGIEDLISVIRAALVDPVFLESGPAARDFILKSANYQNRVRDALACLGKNCSL